MAPDLERWGYCIIDEALDKKTLAAVQRRLTEQAAAERRLHALKNPANPDPINQWVKLLLNKGEVFFDLVQHDLATALAEHLLGPDYLISCIDSQIQHPGAGTMALHADQWWMPPPAVPGGPAARPSAITRGIGTALDPSPSTQPISAAMVVNVMWMITDFSEKTGAVRLSREDVGMYEYPRGK